MSVSGAILIDLSIDISHTVSLVLKHSFPQCFLEDRKQNAKINNTCSMFEILLSGMDRSILDAILFNIIRNNLFLFLTKATINNFTNDNQ